MLKILINMRIVNKQDIGSQVKCKNLPKEIQTSI
nr:MAG TPA: hypothetical protein [Caudoviricetes sp.]